MRERKCIYNYEIHETPIWSLCIDDNFNNFYSGSQDGSVYKVNMKQFETSLFAKYSSGILHVNSLFYNRFPRTLSVLLVKMDQLIFILNWTMKSRRILWRLISLNKMQ